MRTAARQGREKKGLRAAAMHAAQRRLWVIKIAVELMRCEPEPMCLANATLARPRPIPRPAFARGGDACLVRVFAKLTRNLDSYRSTTRFQLLLLVVAFLAVKPSWRCSKSA